MVAIDLVVDVAVAKLLGVAAIDLVVDVAVAKFPGVAAIDLVVDWTVAECPGVDAIALCLDWAVLAVAMSHCRGYNLSILSEMVLDKPKNQPLPHQSPRLLSATYQSLILFPRQRHQITKIQKSWILQSPR